MISRSAKRRIKKILLWMEVTLILVLGAGMGVALGVFYQMNRLLPPDAALDTYRAPVGTKIYSSDGVLLAKLAEENREPVPLEKIPKTMQDAIVAIEDARFYSHSGLDYKGLARALWTNVSGRELAQGASTITMQLARNMFFSQKKKMSRKVKEILMAVQIERKWTKRQILEAYLNQVYFGAGAYGVRSASQTYFRKNLDDLTLEEAALLAGLPQRPSAFNPFQVHAEEGNYKRTKARRDDVLERMAQLGFVTREQAEEAKEKPVKVAKSRPQTVGYFKAKYFCQYVVDELKERYGYDQDLIEKAGLKVVTTLNWKMQQEAEKAAKQGLAKYSGWGNVSEVALISLDPNSGYIRAMVGGVQEPWDKYQFNCATQAKRQPGSSFKTFVYAAALQAGKTPYSSVNGNAAIRMPDGTVWAPKNHGGGGGGMMSYRSAFQSSVNGAAANVCYDVGPRNVANLAMRLGLEGPIPAYPSIALGTIEATPLEMATAYAPFAARGKKAEPLAILRIQNQDGEIVEDVQPKVKDSGLTPQTVEGMGELTRAVVTSGTGRGASRVPNAHGKTGTTEKNTDAWFVGYVPGELVTAVWAGNRNNRPMSHSLYGGTICAPIWADYMEDAVKLNPANKKRPKVETLAKEARPRRARPRPAPAAPSADENDRNRVSATVCSVSGLLARDGCESTERLEFRLGQQPLTRCTLHTGEKPKQDAKKEESQKADAPDAGTLAPAAAGTSD
ncbi:MAG: transglycosylase domain-containing protein [Armatimonadota bacterium]